MLFCFSCMSIVSFLWKYSDLSFKITLCFSLYKWKTDVSLHCAPWYQASADEFCWRS